MPGWTNYHLGKISFRCLFVQQVTFSLGLLWMPYDWQWEKRFEEMNVDSVIIPGGYTKYIQAPDGC